MRTFLLLSALCLATTAVAQSPITGFYTPNTSGMSGTSYSIVVPDTSFNEEETGANLVWNFSNLTNVGSSLSQTSAPTTAQVELYPSSNTFLNTVSDFSNGNNSGNNDIYLSVTPNGASVTGIDINGMTLNYTVDNAYVGLFPLNYGYNNSDAVSGTFTAQQYTGDFTGTFTTTVDAYGTLTTSLGSIPAGTTVTRLKMSQELELSYFGIAVGTLTQTTYSYYNSSILANEPIFRSMHSNVDVAILNINEVMSSVEVYEAQLLSDNPIATKPQVVIAPNPVGDLLHFSGDDNITSVTITDFSGRMVLESALGNDIAVSHLSTGLYSVTVQTETGVSTQKMIKK